MDTKKKVLIVEDDLMLVGVYKDVIESEGFSVETASDGEECMTRLQSYVPDIILLDIFIPKISGFDIIDKLRQSPVLSKIPVIVLTNVYIDREELIQKGVKHCLIKAEVTPGDIVDKIRVILQSTSDSQQPVN